jgi:phospholipase B1
MNLNLFLPILFFMSVSSAVHPSQIECFGVLGDSITAGFSMISGSPRADFIEYRDQVFSIGRKPDYKTLPNIFHDFYPSLNLSASCASNYETLVDYNHRSSQDCNVAISGALSDRLVDMWGDLLFQWNNRNCTRKWKVLTVMIGANDICAYCLTGYNQTISNYMNNVRQLHDQIYRDTQNVFINYVSLFDVSVVMDWQNPKCDIVHLLINECPCILGRNRQRDAREKVGALYQDMNAALYPYIKSLDGERDDIIVRVQPILENFQVYNQSYLSTLDCFHPSAFANMVMGTILWNNMFLPEVQKLKNMEYLLPLYQPTETDILQ